MVSPVLAQAILNQQAPDIVGEFQKGQEVARQKRSRELAGVALQQGGGSALEELRGIDPEVALAIGEQIRAQDSNSINDFIRDARIGFSQLSAGDEQGFLNFAQQRKNALRLQGRDTTQTDQMINLVASGNTEQALQELAAFTGAVDQSKGVVLGAGQRIVDPVSGRVIFEPAAGDIDPQAAQVQSSQILPDGTTIQVLKDGSTRVTSPEGQPLTGEDRSEAIRTAREFGVQISGEGAAARVAKSQIAKDRQELRKTVFGAARQGQQALKEVSSLRKALENVRTGRLAQAKQNIGRLIPGVRDANAEALNSAINEFVLRRKDELLGGGILSDADIALLQSIGPQLGNTIEANLSILDRFEKVAKNDIDRGKRLKQFKGDPLEFDLELFEEQPPAPQQQIKPQPTITQQGVAPTTQASIQFLGFE